MTTMSMGFYFKEGIRVGYDISYPNNFGGRTVIANVAATDKARIIREIKDLGWKQSEIKVERIA